MSKSRPAAGSKTIAARKATAPQKRGIGIERFFTAQGERVYDSIEWELRSAQITNETGKVIFEQKNIEVPKSWSQLATNVVVSKYFRGKIGTPERETSVRQMIDRVANTITEWGLKQGYFVSSVDAEAFRDELKHLLVHQKMSFNSPVWFNVGVATEPQCSACFILSIDDTMESILEIAKTEGKLYKRGSGSGVNYSPLRSSREELSGGGTASGPVPFIAKDDLNGGSIKSGGTTRRAAKMSILNADHGDVYEFVDCKMTSEKMARDLIISGWDRDFRARFGVYGMLPFQNANHSVRVTDRFMQAVENDDSWDLVSRDGGTVLEKIRARDLWHRIGVAAWECGDPGLQFDTTVNHWHPCINTDRINASNPCSEYMFLDDSACNLASLNLRKFQLPDGSFDITAYTAAIRVTILAQEIIVDNSSYPTEKIAENSRRFRPLGLGYANLGALLMSMGLPYDSDEGRAVGGLLTAIMTGTAYAMSARIAAEATGPCDGYAENAEPFLRVIQQHAAAVQNIPQEFCAKYEGLYRAASTSWIAVAQLGATNGFRNGQVTVLAPTGTIGFMMDCDTTGIEPDIALVKYKKLVGGGSMKIVNQTVRPALETLGYSEADIATILAFIDREGTIEGAPGLKPEHLPVFDCAFRAEKGVRSIHYMGHVRMMAAAQPFISGAISKTVNLPGDCTVEDIKDAYMQAWKLGLKAIAIYRDGCKGSQPLSTSQKDTTAVLPAELPPAIQRVIKIVDLALDNPETLKRGEKRRMSDTRLSITHKFSIGGQKGYITVGLYSDGTPGEVFIEMSKQGSFLNGILDAFSKAVTKGLKYGVPLDDISSSFIDVRFDPAGMTSNPTQIPIAQSIVDYIFRWLMLHFYAEETLPPGPGDEVRTIAGPPRRPMLANTGTGEVCRECGNLMIRSGSCHKCTNCGSTSGCS